MAVDILFFSDIVQIDVTDSENVESGTTEVESCVDNTPVTNVLRVDVGSIVVDIDVDVWTMVVDILSPLNVVLPGSAMPPMAVDGLLIDNSKIVIFTKIKKEKHMYVTQMCHG